MRILILGGARFIGPCVVRSLLQQGHALTLFHRRPPRPDAPAGVKHILGDRKQLTSFRDGFAAFSPDVAIDMFAMGEKDAAEAVDALRGIARRLVMVSSIDVYRAYGRLLGSEPGTPDPVPLTETSPLREQLFPLRGRVTGGGQYDKILAERTVLGNDALPGTVLRLPMVYGPGDPQRRIRGYLRRMEDGRPAILLDERYARWRASMGYCDDVGHAIALCAVDERSAGRVYNIGEPEALSIRDWVRAIAEVTGWKGKVLTVPPRLEGGLGRGEIRGEQDWTVDSTRIRRELGYRESIDRRTALEHTLHWERKQPIETDHPDYALEDRILAELDRN